MCQEKEKGSKGQEVTSHKEFLHHWNKQGSGTESEDRGQRGSKMVFCHIKAFRVALTYGQPMGSEEFLKRLPAGGCPQQILATGSHSSPWGPQAPVASSCLETGVGSLGRERSGHQLYTTLRVLLVPSRYWMTSDNLKMKRKPAEQSHFPSTIRIPSTHLEKWLHTGQQLRCVPCVIISPEHLLQFS